MIEIWEKYKYLSSFPIGFRGCFKYGSLDPFQRKECPLDKVQDRATLDKFYREFNIHRLHLKILKSLRDKSIQDAVRMVSKKI